MYPDATGTMTGTPFPPNTSTVDPHWFDHFVGGPTTDDSIIWKRLVDDKEPIFFVGESQTRSLPIALGIMRGSFDGVYASTYHKRVDHRVRSYDELIGTQKERIENNDVEIVRRSMSRVVTKPMVMEDLARFESGLNQWYFYWFDHLFSLQADGTKLRDFFLYHPSISTRNIIWQCPWIHPGQYPPISAVLLDFIKSASSCQQEGDALFVGVTTYPPYYVQYELDAVFSQAFQCGYTRLTTDTKFIRAAIEYGYEHRTIFDTGRSHNQLMNTMEIHGFVKQTRDLSYVEAFTWR